LRELFLARDPGGITPLLETRVIEAQELTLQKRATEAQLAVQAALVELNQLRGCPVDAPITVAPDAKLALPDFGPDWRPFWPPPARTISSFAPPSIELEQQGLVVSLARNEGRPSFTVSPYLLLRRRPETRSGPTASAFPLPLPMRGRAKRKCRRRGGAPPPGRDRRPGGPAQSWSAKSSPPPTGLDAKLAESARWSPDAARRFRDAAELADRHYRLGAVPISTYVELQNSYLEAIERSTATQQEAP
jgi:cobalt-zinc-cadmium efflux system outer membrane protein